MKQKIEEILAQEGVYISTISGTSMVPMLRDRQDTIVIMPVNKPLKKYDVVLYKTETKYVLHRILQIQDKYYIIQGDNCTQKEIVMKEQIVGILVGACRDNREINMKSLKYRCYARNWHKIQSLRQIIRRFGRKIVSVCSK